jgi:mannose-6-phosphate isomerase-like protein (cupin superfamily)
MSGPVPATVPDPSDAVEEVVLGGTWFATIVRGRYHQPGIHFFTPPDSSQQLGFMAHPAGHRIRPHVHREVTRDVRRTQEVLFLRKGRVRVDFYGAGRDSLDSRLLEEGDVILLASGGHGFEVLAACELIEVKQGPYAGDQDKILLDDDRR